MALSNEGKGVKTTEQMEEPTKRPQLDSYDSKDHIPSSQSVLKSALKASTPKFVFLFLFLSFPQSVLSTSHPGHSTPQSSSSTPQQEPFCSQPRTSTTQQKPFCPWQEPFCPWQEPFCPWQEPSTPQPGTSTLQYEGPNTKSFISTYRFGSFAPVREGPCQVKWLIDGKDYMSAVADAIESARHEIFITDWQIHPYVHLKRPDTGVTSLEWRLDKLLIRKADENVRIYILLYWETKLAMDLGSSFAMTVLKHPNIVILRHPTWFTFFTHPSTLLRWSHHEKLVVIDQSIAFVGGIDLCFGRWDTSAHPLVDNHPHHPIALETQGQTIVEEAEEQYCRWVGKDYSNTFLAGVRDELDKPLEEILDKESPLPIRYTVPRMPWHDVSCMFNGEAVLDISKHFIQRFNQIHQNSPSVPVLSEQCWNQQEDNHQIKNPDSSNVKIQVVSSVASWSANQQFEDSIHKAYRDAIKNAKHSIYIENQFFISSQDGNVENQIQADIAKRIARAYYSDEDFYVMILLPLQPEFPGEWGTKSGKDLEAVSYWNYASLYNGEHSLWARLKDHGVPFQYQDEHVQVYGLRTHDELNGEFVTELIYVHDKLMIVDDRKTIIGSANINDRSMSGDRDSEVDVVIEDQEMIPGRMNGKPYEVGKFSHTLRCQLMKEHLGLLENPGYSIDVSDPASKHFFDTVSSIAKENSKIYLDVFGGRIIPNNQIFNQEDLERWKTVVTEFGRNKDLAKYLLEQIRGHIVKFPYTFLMDYLKPSHLDLFKIYVGNFPIQEPYQYDSGGGTYIC